MFNYQTDQSYCRYEKVKWLSNIEFLEVGGGCSIDLYGYLRYQMGLVMSVMLGLSEYLNQNLLKKRNAIL